MGRLPQIIPVSDLRQRVAQLLLSLKDRSDPVFITQRGRTAAVLMGIKEYERIDRERELLRELVRGEKKTLRGAGHSLEDVLADIDDLLKESD